MLETVVAFIIGFLLAYYGARFLHLNGSATA